MKRVIKKSTARSLIVFALAVVLIGGASLGAAWAYFTTYARALGSRQISLKDTTTIEERVDGDHKYVKITNNSNSTQPVYVRVAAFVGSSGTLDTSESDPLWSESDGKFTDTSGGYGYYYYKDELMPGETSNELVIKITLPKLPEGVVMEDDRGVTVVYESTPVLYNGDYNKETGEGTLLDAAGNRSEYVGWNLRTDQVTNKTPDTTEGGN